MKLQMSNIWTECWLFKTSYINNLLNIFLKNSPTEELFRTRRDSFEEEKNFTVLTDKGLARKL